MRKRRFTHFSLMTYEKLNFLSSILRKLQYYVILISIWKHRFWGDNYFVENTSFLCFIVCHWIGEWMKVQIQRRFLSFSFRFCCYFGFLHFESLCFLILCLLLFCCLVCLNVYALSFCVCYHFAAHLILFESCHFQLLSLIESFCFLILF